MQTLCEEQSTIAEDAVATLTEDYYSSEAVAAVDEAQENLYTVIATCANIPKQEELNQYMTESVPRL